MAIFIWKIQCISQSCKTTRCLYINPSKCLYSNYYNKCFTYTDVWLLKKTCDFRKFTGGSKCFIVQEYLNVSGNITSLIPTNQMLPNHRPSKINRPPPTSKNTPSSAATVECHHFCAVSSRNGSFQ